MINERGLARRVGEPFPLFDPSGTIRVNEYLGKKGFFQPFKLSTNELNTPIPLLVNASVNNIYHKGVAMTPFQPELGYQISQEDFTVAGRWRKTGLLGRENIDFNQNPLSLGVSDYGEETLYIHQRHDYPNEVLQVVKRLRLQLDFPRGAYEAKAWLSALLSGIITFEHFYPLDLGPMPVDNTLYEGLWIMLPSDLAKLQQIIAKFVLTDSENHIMR